MIPPGGDNAGGGLAVVTWVMATNALLMVLVLVFVLFQG